MGIAYFVFPYAFATTDTRFRRTQFIVIALAPLVALMLIGVPLMFAFEWVWLTIPLALDAGGAVGDVWMVLMLLSYPASITVLDSTTGLKVYGSADLKQWETSPATVVWDLLVRTAGGVLIVAIIVGVIIPPLLLVSEIDSITLGVPNSPFFVFSFSRGIDNDQLINRFFGV